MNKFLKINDAEIELHAFEEKNAANETIIEVLLLDASFAEGGDKIICKFSMSSKGEILERDSRHPIPRWLSDAQVMEVVIEEALRMGER